MNKLITAMLATFGLGSSSQASPPQSQVDPKTIQFSMPTVAADVIQFEMPSPESFNGAPQFHEDEWRQVEFYPGSFLPTLQKRLAEYKSFEQNHRTPNGWSQIYARRIPNPKVIEGPRALADLSAKLGATLRPSPILLSSSRPLGQVKGGYTLQLADSVFLYGSANSSGIESLSAIVQRGGDDLCLTMAFVQLHKSFKLILVDWRSQSLLMSVNPNGQIVMWRP